MSSLKSISPPARELFSLSKSWFAIRTADGKFSILGSTKRKPKLPPGTQIKGPFRFRESAERRCLTWSTQKAA
jgi:hypothetical protein